MELQTPKQCAKSHINHCEGIFGSNNITTFPTHLKGHHFGTAENVQAAATRALNNISSEDFLHCYEEWHQHWNSCIRSQGGYFEGDKL